MNRTMAALAMLAVAGVAGGASAHEYRLGDLHIDHPVLCVASPVSKTGAGYLTISNHGRQADRLLAVITDASTRADLHGTQAQGGVMMMRAQAGGVPVPAGGTVRFAPGGLHVMFIGLKQALPAGRMVKARLRFARAGEVAVAFKVEDAASAAGGPVAGHSGHH